MIVAIRQQLFSEKDNRINENNDESNNNNIVKLPWIQVIGPKI